MDSVDCLPNLREDYCIEELNKNKCHSCTNDQWHVQRHGRRFAPAWGWRRMARSAREKGWMQQWRSDIETTLLVETSLWWNPCRKTQCQSLIFHNISQWGFWRVGPWIPTSNGHRSWRKNSKPSRLTARPSGASKQFGLWVEACWGLLVSIGYWKPSGLCHLFFGRNWWCRRCI